MTTPQPSERAAVAVPAPFAVWKFPLDFAAVQTVRMPLFARILCVQVQYGKPTLWALVNTAAAKENQMQVPVYLVGTGHPVPENADYVGSVQLDEGALVLHVFHAAHQARFPNE